ncbi:ATP-dependent Clp protease proteolytic subunit-related protein 2, chloroplastic [Linum perenne]
MASMLNTNLHQPSLSLGTTKLCSGSKPQSSSPALQLMCSPLSNSILSSKAARYDVYTALQKRRIIFIPRGIDEKYSNILLGTMLYLDSIDDTSRLYFYFNGPGGELTPSLSIYDGIKALSSPIGTHNIGYTFNMATFMLAAGDKGYRSALPYCRMALESPAGAARGQAVAMKVEGDELVRIKNYLYKEFSKNTGQPVEKIEKDMKNGGLLLTSEQAMDYGIIDKIIRPSSIVGDIDDNSNNSSPWSSPPGYH